MSASLQRIQGRELRHGDTADEINDVCSRLATEDVLGFDQEWQSNGDTKEHPNRIAVVQLAGKNEVLVAQIHFLQGLCCPLCPVARVTRLRLFVFCTAFPRELRRILESATVIKTGVSIKRVYLPTMISSDCSRLVVAQRIRKGC